MKSPLGFILLASMAYTSSAAPAVSVRGSDPALIKRTDH